ncbi:MAG: hypothetical protein KGJ24_03715 [Burkholderiales bacterium]|nr:hypothetical protein [Burkholderiales bacterium]MDE2564210.1 hypothetical protein [Burkholderiales bacterium]
MGLLVLLLGPALAGCSAVRLAYDTGPQLAWWWLDGYVDFSAAQEPQVKADLRELFAWNRQTQLPSWAALLGEAEADAGRPATPALACRWADRLRDALQPTIDHGLVQAADLVPGLGPPQFSAIDRHFAKVMRQMREDYLQPDLAARHEASVERTVERVERLYGRLQAPQRRVIEAGIAASPFDPEAWAAERRRRQIDTLQTLRRLVAERAGPAERLAALRGLVDKLEHSPDPAYRAYQQRLVAYSCAFAARIHNATTPAQRAHAQGVLQGWREDFSELAATPPVPPG